MSSDSSDNKLELKTETLSKFEILKSTLKEMGTVLIAFSGGVDSSFLLKTAQEVLGDRVLAVIAKSETYPEKEQEEAVRLAEEWNVHLKVIKTDELDNPEFVQNPPTRCYFCKNELFSKLKEIASSEGILFVCDGSNYEDLDDFRPGPGLYSIAPLFGGHRVRKLALGGIGLDRDPLQNEIRTRDDDDSAGPGGLEGSRL